MKSLVAAFLPILAGLYGCPSDEPGNHTPVARDVETRPAASGATTHFEGNWQGTLTSGSSQTTYAAIALVNGWGEFRLIADHAQFVGWPQRTATTIAGPVTGIRSAGSTWNDDSHSAIFELHGKIAEDDFIEAGYEGGGESGQFALAWAAGAESRIESIIGTWVRYDETGNVMATFQIDGIDRWAAGIRGSHANGCAYSGRTEAWTSRYAYDVVPFELAGCPLDAGIDLNGTYAGTAALLDLEDDQSDEQVLVMALSRDLRYQVTFFLHRDSD